MILLGRERMVPRGMRGARCCRPNLGAWRVLWLLAITVGVIALPETARACSTPAPEHLRMLSPADGRTHVSTLPRVVLQRVSSGAAGATPDPILDVRFIVLIPDDEGPRVSLVPRAWTGVEEGYAATVTNPLEPATTYAIWAVGETNCDPADLDAPCHDEVPAPTGAWARVGSFRTHGPDETSPAPESLALTAREQTPRTCARTDSCCFITRSVSANLTFATDLEAVLAPSSYMLVSSAGSIGPLRAESRVIIDCASDLSGVPSSVVVPAGEYTPAWISDEGELHQLGGPIALGLRCDEGGTTDGVDAGPNDPADAGAPSAEPGRGGCSAASAPASLGWLAGLLLVIALQAWKQVEHRPGVQAQRDRPRERE